MDFKKNKFWILDTLWDLRAIHLDPFEIKLNAIIVNHLDINLCKNKAALLNWTKYIGHAQYETFPSINIFFICIFIIIDFELYDS